MTDGTHTANIALLGNYLASTFVPSSDGHGGTSIVNPASVTLAQYPLSPRLSIANKIRLGCLAPAVCRLSALGYRLKTCRPYLVTRRIT